MISLKQFINYLAEKPFRPFRIHMASGRTFDVRHQELVLVGVNTVRVYTAVDEDDDNEQWHDVLLTLMEQIELLPATNSSK